MTDWTTVSALATGGGTLVLALATFSSVRAANRSAKVSERALLVANLPILVSSHIYDPEDKIRFREDKWVKVKGGHAHAEVSRDAIYFVISVRNAGQGPAVLDSWSLSFEEDPPEGPGDIQAYRRLTRDLYVAPGDTGLWQGAIRDTKDPQFAKATAAIKNHDVLRISIKYGDQEGNQHTVSMFALSHLDKNDWLSSVVRHWRLDGADPR